MQRTYFQIALLTENLMYVKMFNETGTSKQLLPLGAYII